MVRRSRRGLIRGGASDEASDSETKPEPEPTAAITLTAFEGAEVDVLHPTIRSFVDNRTDAKAQAEALKAEETKTVGYNKQYITFSWTKEGAISVPYTLSFADNANFENAFEHEVNSTSCSDVGFFIPGTTYYWKVTSADGTTSNVDTFVVKETPVRMISAGTMWNVRDMGGWSAGEGQRVAYGKLFRGDDPNTNANQIGLKTLRYLGIKGEIDLRLDSTATQNFQGAEYPLLVAGIKYFYQVVPGEYDYSTEITDNIGKIFKFLADESNYPVYVHCTYGKDRTGTIGYLINGLLGVNYDDLMCDYELSSFGQTIKSQPRNAIMADPNGGWKFTDAKDDPWGAVGRLDYVIKQKYAADTTSESIAKYLTTACGVTEEEIAKVKEILLESTK